MGSLEHGDAEAAAVQKTPNRVTLASMEAKIAGEYSFTLDSALAGCPGAEDLAHITVCVLRTVSGYVLMGKSAPADAGNFNADLGRKFAREDAIRQMWPLEGYALRERLHNAA